MAQVREEPCMCVSGMHRITRGRCWCIYSQYTQSANACVLTLNWISVNYLIVQPSQIADWFVIMFAYSWRVTISWVSKVATLILPQMCSWSLYSISFESDCFFYQYYGHWGLVFFYCRSWSGFCGISLLSLQGWSVACGWPASYYFQSVWQVCVWALHRDTGFLRWTHVYYFDYLIFIS